MSCMSPGNDIEIPDLNELVYEAMRQIPTGMVSTYGDISRALGDVRASRAVGVIVAANPVPISNPCHRVVYSDGRVGWYGGMGKGNAHKIELLRSEGVKVEGGRVADFPLHRFTDFDIRPLLKEMMDEQTRLRKMVVLQEDPSEIERVVGLDVSYHGDVGFAASACYDHGTGDLIEESVVRGKVGFPYIPGYLSYRELPVLAPLIREKEGTVFMVDGQGWLHPRHFGIACHLGVFFDVPSIGVAKSLLCGEIQETDGGTARVLMDGRTSGTLLKMEGKKGIFISVGNKLSLPRCESICRAHMKNRIPEPLRRAHSLANQARTAWLEG